MSRATAAPGRADRPGRATSRAPAVERLDRALLGLLGLVLLLSGLVALALGGGLLGERAARRPVLGDELDRVTSAWPWWAVALSALAVALLALWWLTAQLRVDAVRAVHLESDGGGRTTLSTRAVTDALAEEIGGYPGVASVGARFRHLRPPVSAPAAQAVLTAELRLVVVLVGSADLAAVRRRVETVAAAHVRAALEQPDLPVRVEYRLARAPRWRAR